MGRRVLSITNWSDGRSNNRKEGPTNSFGDSQAVDFRSDPSSLTVLPRAVKESGTVITSEITQFERLPNGDVYAAGGNKVYKRVKNAANSLGVWSVESLITGISKVTSMIYRTDNDTLYMPDAYKVHTVSTVSGTRVFNLDKIVQLIDANIDDPDATAVAAATTGPSLTDVTKFASYQPGGDELMSVSVKPVTAPGASNWRVKIYDQLNTLVATSNAIVASSIVVNTFTTFTFPSPVKLKAKPNALTYKIVVEDDANAGTVRTQVSGDMSTMLFKTRVRPLQDVPHPAIQFLQYNVFGNGNKVAVYEPLSNEPTTREFNPNRIVIPSEYEIIGFATGYQEYLAIAAYKKVSADYGGQFGQGGTEGIMFFWDGTSTTYNFYEKIPEGAPESIYGYKGALFYVASGVQYVWAGGRPVPLNRFPGVDKFKSDHGHSEDVYLQAAPFNASAVYKGILVTGFPYLSVNDNIKQGVYSFGSNHRDYNDGFSYDYLPSHGSTGFQYASVGTPPVPMSGITCLKTVGANLLVAWKHAASGVATYGVDVIKDSNPPAPFAYVEERIFDGMTSYKEKNAIQHIVTHAQLPEDTSIDLKYRINRAGDFIDGGADKKFINTDEDIHKTILNVDKHFKEIELRIEFTSGDTIDKRPEIYSNNLLHEDLRDEED